MMLLTVGHGFSRQPPGPGRRLGKGRIVRTPTWVVGWARAERRGGCKALRDRRGVVAMELAILCIPLFVLLLGAMEVSYDMFVQQALNSALETVARTVQVGATQGASGETSQQLVAAVCPLLSKLLSCVNLTVAVEPVAPGNDYYTSSVHSCLSYSAAANNKGGEVDTGTGGQLMVMGAWYNGPTFLGALVPKFSMSNGYGGLMHQTFSSVGFVNEYFGAGQGSGAIGGNGC